MKKKVVLSAAILFVSMTFMGFGRCGEGLERWFSTEPAPDVRGDWQVDYDDSFTIEVNIGGAVHDAEIIGESGTMTFMHEGQEVSLELDCSKAWIVCPSEVFAPRVTLEQRRFQERPHQVHMSVNTTECQGQMRLPDESAGECDSSDENRPCDVEICDGTVVDATETTIGSISEAGQTVQRHPPFDIELFLGGDFAVPTPNCVLGRLSAAQADIVYTGDYDPDATEPTMEATDFENGEIVTVYGGACFWFESDYNEDLKAALLSATITLKTGFTAAKTD